MEQEERLCDEVKTVFTLQFTYLGDRVIAGAGCEVLTLGSTVIEKCICNYDDCFLPLICCYIMTFFYFTKHI